MDAVPTNGLQSGRRLKQIGEYGAILLGKHERRSERVFAWEFGEGEDMKSIIHATTVKHSSGLEATVTKGIESFDGSATNRLEDGSRAFDHRAVFRQPN